VLKAPKRKDDVGKAKAAGFRRPSQH